MMMIMMMMMLCPSSLRAKPRHLPYTYIDKYIYIYIYIYIYMCVWPILETLQTKIHILSWLVENPIDKTTRLRLTYCLVVEPPLWKIWKSVGMIIPKIWEKHVPNHQPANIQKLGGSRKWVVESLWIKGINNLSTGAGYLPSTVVYKPTRLWLNSDHRRRAKLLRFLCCSGCSALVAWCQASAKNREPRGDLYDMYVCIYICDEYIICL